MCDKGFYAITCLAREDIEGTMGKDIADKLTDKDLGIIAHKMGDAYVEFDGFWEDMKIIVEGYLDLHE